MSIIRELQLVRVLTAVDVMVFTEIRLHSFSSGGSREGGGGGGREREHSGHVPPSIYNFKGRIL